MCCHCGTHRASESLEDAYISRRCVTQSYLASEYSPKPSWKNLRKPAAHPGTSFCRSSLLRFGQPPGGGGG